MISEEYTETEEYITEDNDPEYVLIVPEDDYVIDDGEEIMQHEVVQSTIYARSSEAMRHHDYERDNAVLNALRKGEFTK